MKAGSGSLAIGELVGAASFIVSVVAGSMTIVRPFRVPRHSFLRDVGFFTFAIAFILYIIHDGQIVRWEASALIFLYLAYVLVVALGSWYLDRKHRRRELVRKVRSEYAEDGQEIQPYRDDRSLSFIIRSLSLGVDSDFGFSLSLMRLHVGLFEQPISQYSLIWNLNALTLSRPPLPLHTCTLPMV